MNPDKNFRGRIVDWQGNYLYGDNDQDGLRYRVEAGQSATLRRQITDNGLGYLLERHKEEQPWRPYSLEEIPVLFILSGRTTRHGEPYATNLQLDRETLDLAISGKLVRIY